MLIALSIRNIVLIDKLDLEFQRGLTALTGETGAGKSILLDSFGLALGARGDARLVREGQDKGQVTAVFELPAGHKAFDLLAENETRSKAKARLSCAGSKAKTVAPEPLSMMSL